ncbi:MULTISPECIES: helix-turn-helix domain-containing protein [Streptomyces]|uniref:helix-turn-helix domain-containing protein n=1 Tax=Streptomyces TaxID=1883 RepID=UPI000998BFDB
MTEPGAGDHPYPTVGTDRGRPLTSCAPFISRPETCRSARVTRCPAPTGTVAAVALEVHRGTVRQRIARAAALVGADLADADVRVQVAVRAPG